MTALVQFVGREAIGLVVDSAGLWRLSVSAVGRGLVAPFHRNRFRPRIACQQMVRAGVGSLPLVGLLSLLVGMTLALQAAYQLRQLGAVNLVPDLVALSLTRELAPLMTAIIVTGRVGSAIAAEIGTMKVSQEIDALTVMGIDPISFLVVPRLVALLMALPCLTILADVIGILGGMGVGVLVLGMGPDGYIVASLSALEQQDLWSGLLKAVAFGGVIGLVSCHQGLETQGGAEEVGRSTTSAVVRSIVIIIGVDLFVTAIAYLRG